MVEQPVEAGGGQGRIVVEDGSTKIRGVKVAGIDG